MNWRQWIGLRPTQADLANDLLRSARESGQTGWVYDVTDSSLRHADRIVNLGNIHREYAQAGYLARPGLLRKYQAMLAPESTADEPKLWTLAQKAIFPILRSRYERTVVEIEHRSKDPFPPRASKPFLGHLEAVIGYDHGQTVSQVTLETASDWGVSIDEALQRALVNLRALPPPTWESAGDRVRALESEGGYTESFLQLPRTFDNLPAKGQALAMIPNRGVLLSTGSDESGGLAALLAAAKESMQQAPWPLTGDLFHITAAGPELHVPDDRPNATLSAAIQRLDISSAYAGQKTALDIYHEAINEDVFVATYGLPKDRPEEVFSWCSWTMGVPSLLPVTDTVALVRDVDGSRKVMRVPWADLERLLGHYFKPTSEDPTRIRVDGFPTPDELTELQKMAG